MVVLSYVSTTVPIPISSAADTTVAIPQFNAALGTLVAILFTGPIEHHLVLKSENINAGQAATVRWEGQNPGEAMSSQFKLKTPGALEMFSNSSNWQPLTSRLGAYDGTNDFGGLSGHTVALDQSADLAPAAYATPGGRAVVYTNAAGLTEMTGAGSATCLVARVLFITATSDPLTDVARGYDHYIGALALTVTYAYTPV